MLISIAAFMLIGMALNGGAGVNTAYAAQSVGGTLQVTLTSNPPAGNVTPGQVINFTAKVCNNASATTTDPNVVTVTNVTVTTPAGSTNSGPFNLKVGDCTPNINFSFTAPASGSFSVTVTAGGNCDPNFCTPHDTKTLTFTVVPPPPPVRGCTFTQGYYKTHPQALPATMKLGTVTYTRSQLVSILQTPVQGNGLIALAYQLIAAQANQTNGASTPSAVQTAINQANALIDGKVIPPVGSGFLDPSVTSGLTDILDRYNNGLAAGGPPHCD